jgi:HPt (histidine-containing phosphotransfer) domain-containing protein
MTDETQIAFFKELQDEYLDELQDILNSLDELVIELQDNSENLELSNELWRKVHSLKGTAGTFGFKFISKACHNWEDLMEVSDREKNKDKERTNSFYQKYADIIYVLQEFQSNPYGEPELLEQQLKDIILDNIEQTKRVLILENSSMMMNFYTEELHKYGYQISYARDGYLALGRLLNEKFDLIITSVDVSTIDGLSLINSLRVIKNPNQNSQAVLITSNSLNESDLLKNKSNVILTKDLVMKELPKLLAA